jgi:uncharacterized protein (TIGR02453 family)
MLEPQTLKFISQLKKNNSKEWFDAHRPAYEAARTDFSNFMQLVIEDLQRTDTTITGLTSKDCMFRINRDVRFSKNKSPYKTNFGAIIKRGGRKSIYAGYYFHCEPGQSFVGGGLWMPGNEELKKVRQEIDYNWDSFKKIISSKDFKKTYGDLFFGNDIQLSRPPKGYAPDHSGIEYLKLKCFIAEKAITDEELIKSSLHKKTVEAFITLKPLVDFINESFE